MLAGTAIGAALAEKGAAAALVHREVPSPPGMAVVQVDNLTNRLMDLLNTSTEGNFIFGGTRTDTPPFVRNGKPCEGIL